MLYQAYTNDPSGFEQNILPLLTQNQQGQFQQVVRRQVEVRNAEGAFGGGNVAGGRPSADEGRAIGQPVEVGGGGPQVLPRSLALLSARP